VTSCERFTPPRVNGRSLGRPIAPRIQALAHGSEVARGALALLGSYTQRASPVTLIGGHGGDGADPRVESHGYQVGAAWPSPGRCGTRRGRTSAIGPQTPKLGWWRNLAEGSVGDASIAADGTIYVPTSNPSQIWALDGSTGMVRWTFGLKGGSGSATGIVIAANGTLYFGSNHRELYALAPSGEALWTFTTGRGSSGDGFVTAPVIAANGTLYFGASDKRLYALAPDGAVLFAHANANPIAGAPAIGIDGTIVYGTQGSADGAVIALHPDGTPKWTLRAGPILASPVIGDDGTIFVGTQDGALHAIRPDGAPLWSFRAGARIYAPAAIAPDGTIIVGAEDMRLHALHPDGTHRFSVTVDGPVSRAPAIGGDGTIYLGTQKQTVYAFRPDGSTLWTYGFRCARGDRSAPAIAHDGKLVVLGAFDWRYSAIVTFDP
jgi:outer membrane protein assembly factor BamB